VCHVKSRFAAVLLTGVVALAALGASLAAVESSGSGTVTGMAAPCIGVITSSEYAAIPVRISLRQVGHTVSTETVHGRSRFRFVVPAGSYLLTSDATHEAGLPSQPITVKANETVRLDLIPHCK
jgi:hypothetical protein